MKIKRNIKGEEVEFELTQDELYEASREVKINFYLGELQASFPQIKEKDRMGVAEDAYWKYCKIEGLTEYEALELAVEEYKK